METEVVKNEVECFLENMAQVESLWILKLTSDKHQVDEGIGGTERRGRKKVLDF